MDELFKYLGGCCPHCDGEVNIVEGMVFDYTLDKDGNPKYLNSEEYKVAAYCKRCEKCLYVAPNGQGGYTVYPYDSAIPYMLYEANRGSDKIKRSSLMGIKLLETDGNPFVNITDEDDCPF